MFRNSRPRPSRQTIELVRQFAYITGGALCGVTALYLEECRRRIQIVQRVLDKRRAIVQAAQSRRYSRAAVAARFDDADTEEIHFPGPRLQDWSGTKAENESIPFPPTQQSNVSRRSEHRGAQVSRVVEHQEGHSAPNDVALNSRVNFRQRTGTPEASFSKTTVENDGQSNEHSHPRSMSQDRDLQQTDEFAPDVGRTRRRADPARSREYPRRRNLIRFQGSFDRENVKAQQYFDRKQAIDEKITGIIRFHKSFGGRKAAGRRAVVTDNEVPEVSRTSQNVAPLPAAGHRNAEDIGRTEAPFGLAESLEIEHDQPSHAGTQPAIPDPHTPSEEAAIVPAVNLLYAQNPRLMKDSPDDSTSWLPEQVEDCQPFYLPPAKRRRTSRSETIGENAEAGDAERDYDIRPVEQSDPLAVPVLEDNNDLTATYTPLASSAETRDHSDNPPNKVLTKRQRHELWQYIDQEMLEPPSKSTLTQREREAWIVAKNKRLGHKLVRPAQSDFYLQTDPLKVRKYERSERIAALIQQRKQACQNDNVEAAEALIPVTLREGSLDDVTSLCQWMLDVKIFKPGHGRDLIDAAPTLAHAYDPEKVFEFCARLLDNPDYASMDPEENFRQRIRLLIHTLEWKLPQGTREIGKRLLNRRRILAKSESKVRVLHLECEHLIASGQTSRATEVLLLAQRSWPKGDGRRFSDLLPVTNMIMESIVEVGDLQCFRRIILWSQGFQKPEDLKLRFNELVEATGRQKSYEALTDVLAHTARQEVQWSHQWTIRTWMDLADGPNKATVAVACSIDPRLRPAFEDLYRQVPEEFRHYVNENASVETVRATWKVTRNLEAVEREAERLSTLLKAQEDDTSLSKLNDTLLEIYLNNGKYDRALDRIASIHQKRQGDVGFLTLAALYFARSWKWDGLHHLLDLSQLHAPFKFDERSTTLFNDAIRFYIQDHSPIECWMFICSAIDELGFTPNFGTVQMMLGKLVQDKALDLLPRWLRFIAVVRPDLDLTGAQSGGMIRKYYIWSRQPSDVLFELCHRLTVSVPSFTADHFKTTLKIAIGHDLRFGSGRGDASAIQYEALTRLKSLETAADVVPHPDDVDETTDQAPASDLGWYNSTGEMQANDPGSEQHYHDLIAMFNEDVDSAKQEANFVVKEEYDVPEDPAERFHDLIPLHDKNTVSSEQNADSAIGEDYNIRDERDELLSRDRDFKNGVQGDALEQTADDEGIGLADDMLDTPRTDDNGRTIRKEYSSAGQRERTAEMLRTREIEEDISLALALHRYQEALTLYRGSCDATGLPASVRTLRHAIDASIRLHDGDTTAAEEVIAEAKKAGMDVHRAMDPLLIHRTTPLAVGDAKAARSVCDATIEYYAENFKGGYNLRYALAHTVANVLTSRGYAQEALRLLAAVFQSNYATRKMSSIKTMSVWLKAYGQLLSMQGLQWVIKLVLTQNMTIDRIFLGDLDRVSRHPFHESDQRRIRGWLKMCQDRRVEQDLEAKVFGHQLVDCLIGYALKYPPRRETKRSRSTRTVWSQARSRRQGADEVEVSEPEPSNSLLPAENASKGLDPNLPTSLSR